ncbi:hypothetical protein DINM_003852 [Dirofilaria immitis]|nr:hypothetical protein [Dirofilaria immitis]
MAENLYKYRYDDNIRGYDMKYTGMDSTWSSVDTKRAVLFSLVPGALSLCAATSFRKEKNLVDWWLLRLWDVHHIWHISMAVVGLENNATKLALALYGGSIFCAFLTMPLLFRNTLIMHLTGAGAALAFFKIYHKAGLLLLPYVLWTGFYTFLSYSMSKTNTSEASERSTL